MVIKNYMRCINQYNYTIIYTKTLYSDVKCKYYWQAKSHILPEQCYIIINIHLTLILGKANTENLQFAK